MARQFNPGQIKTGSLFNISSSYALTASIGLNAVSSSFATTASFVNPLTQTVTLNGKLIQTGSHAEGINTYANGQYSHAEGINTYATGYYSHAEGFTTYANGDASHAEGRETIASSHFSHAEGYGTVASGSYQHVQGQFNLSSSAESAFIVGNGTSNAARSNLIFASGSTVQVTGSLMINDILQLSRRTTTPIAVEGMIIASGSAGASKVYYYNGTAWHALF